MVPLVISLIAMPPARKTSLSGSPLEATSKATMNYLKSGRTIAKQVSESLLMYPKNNLIKKVVLFYKFSSECVNTVYVHAPQLTNYERIAKAKD